MVEILYSHALDAKGDRRSISDEAGVRPFRCGDCGNVMVARRGKVNRWHYAHKANHECVPKADPDNALHRFAQDIIVESFNERRKDGGDYNVRIPCGRSSCDNSAIFNVVYPGASIRKESVVVGGTRSDLVVDVPGLDPIIIEVVNTHDLEDETRQRYRESGCRVVVRKVSWDDLDELARECRADGVIDVIKWMCGNCRERQREQRRQAIEERRYAEERAAKVERRKKVIDLVVGSLNRRRMPRPAFVPWYEVLKENWTWVREPVKMFPKVQRKVFANAVILTELGFEQHNKRKLYLFRFRVRRNPSVYIYGDLGGLDVVPIYEDTAVMLYAPDLDEFPELEEYAVSAFATKLQEAGASVRVRFEADMHLESRETDPTRHVDMRMIEEMVNWDSVRQMKKERDSWTRMQREEERERQRRDDWHRAEVERIKAGGDGRVVLSRDELLWLQDDEGELESQ